MLGLVFSALLAKMLILQYELCGKNVENIKNLKWEQIVLIANVQ